MNIIIRNVLATGDLGDNYYPMPEELLKTGQKYENTNWTICDVRDLYDDGSNEVREYARKIHEAIVILKEQDKVIICCGGGISRSNAIAIGVLVKHFEMSFQDAFNLVADMVPVAAIEEGHIHNLQKLFKINPNEQIAKRFGPIDGENSH